MGERIHPLAPSRISTIGRPVTVIAVDAMGGDLAPGAAVAGAVEAAHAHGIHICLVGARDVIARELARFPHATTLPIHTVDAPDAIGMDEAPIAAIRKKPRASVKVAADLVARGEAAAFFSAGHTGATLFAAHAVFGMIPGIDRPALAVTVPTRTGSAILLDAGANLECRPEHLVQFAHMGAAFAKAERRLERPAVGLLSIGEEAGKGTDLVREAHAALSETSLNFIGNLEARDLFSGRADVVVCDGFTGNIALKVGEGLVETVEQLLRQELASAPIARFGAWLGREAFRRFKRRVDYTEFGGAPLLGVAGLAVVGHGSSPARAICNGIVMTARLAQAGLTGAMNFDRRPVL